MILIIIEIKECYSMISIAFLMCVVGKLTFHDIIFIVQYFIKIYGSLLFFPKYVE